MSEPIANETTSYIIRRPDELDKIAESWNALSNGARLPMQTYAWVRACAEVFAAHGTLHVVVVAAGGRPLAIAPLVKRRQETEQLRLLGVDELSEPMDFLCENETALAALADTLVRSGLPLILARVPADSAATEILRRAARGKGVFVRRLAPPCPRVVLDAGWRTPLERLSASRRSLLRRMRRRAEAMGRVTCDVLAPKRSEVAALLDEAFAVEAASWKGRRGTALANHSPLNEFFRSYAFAACDEGVLRLCFLRIDGRAAAMLYAVEFNERFWTFKIGFDEAFASCSPGNLLVEEAIRHAAERGLETFEFLGRVEDWTRAWTRDECHCACLRFYPFRPEGTRALGLDTVHHLGERIRRVTSRKAGKS